MYWTGGREPLSLATMILDRNASAAALLTSPLYHVSRVVGVSGV